jgi:hypothetical protein
LGSALCHKTPVHICFFHTIYAYLLLYLAQIASKALYEYSNQYPSLLGIPELRQAVARHSTAQQDIPCDWTTDTLVTVGATEGIAAAFMGMVNPGDEVRQGHAVVCCGVLCCGERPVWCCTAQHGMAWQVVPMKQQWCSTAQRGSRVAWWHLDFLVSAGSCTCSPVCWIHTR